MTATQHSALWNMVYPRDLLWALFSISYTHHPLPISLSSTSCGIISTLMIPSCIYLLKLTVAMISHWPSIVLNAVSMILTAAWWIMDLNLITRKLNLSLLPHNFVPGLPWSASKWVMRRFNPNLLPGIDHCLNLTEHVKKICVSCHYHLRNISKIRKYWSEDTSEILVHAFISSKLEKKL